MMDESVHFAFLGVSGQPSVISHHQPHHSKISESSVTSSTPDSGMDEIRATESEKDNSATLDSMQLQHDGYGSRRSSRIFMTPSPHHSQSMFTSHDYDPTSPPPPPLPPSTPPALSSLVSVQSMDMALRKDDLKPFAHERDPTTRKDMMQPTKSESRRPTSATGDPKSSGLASFTKHGVGGSDKALSSTRDYDRLRTQCESAMRELQSLRRQHSETMRKCEMSMKESEFYRLQHKHALAKLDLQQGEALALRTQCNEVIADKHRLEHEVADLQKFRDEDRKEVAELRRQQQEAMNESGNSEAINQMYITAVRKYEAIKDDYDSLRKRYADLIASHSAAASKLELNQEEVARLKKQLEDVIQERNGAVRERNGLKQQCTAAIRQWDSALRERNEAKESLAKVQQQRDEAMKEINQAMAVRIKATKDLARLNEERNAAVQEYTLIMSERDSVHKEIEKLHEELGERTAKVKGLEAQRKASLEEVETLRREIVSALHDRDKALKHCHVLKEKYGDYDDVGISDGGVDYDEGPSKDYDYYQQKSRNASAAAQATAAAAAADHKMLQMGDSSQKASQKKERMDDLDQANQEIDRLRKHSEKLQTELGEALQESEVSKRRRDWAFSERDKIVQERESIRTLCDKLRRERDRAVSDLAEALRDSDDIKKQRNEASKELKEMRERIEAQLEKESRLKQLNSIGHNHSRDSAIDTDLQEWETETLELEIGAANDEELGFELAGGKDDPQFPDGPVYVSSVMKGGAADGKLRVNDCLMRVNHVSLVNAERRTAVDTVRNCGSTFNMVVRRRRLMSSRFIQSVHLNVAGSREHGLQLETGVYVSRISPGSVAAKEGNLALGDRVININGRFLEGMWSGVEAMKLLDSAGDGIIVLSLFKCIHVSNGNGGPLSSSSSGHNLQENGNGGCGGGGGGDAIDKSSNSPKSSHRLPASDSPPIKEFDSVYGGHNRESSFAKRTTTSSSQTDHALLVSSPDRKVDKANWRQHQEHHHQNNNHHHHHQTFLEKIFGERRSSNKDRGNGGQPTPSDRGSPWTSPPSAASPVLEEEEVIAELDSVIEHFKKGAATKAGSGKRRTKRGDGKEQARNNGGTWPKYRGPPPLEYGDDDESSAAQCHSGTMSRTRGRRKERISISSLLNNASVKPFYDPTKKTTMEHGDATATMSGRSTTMTSSTRRPTSTNAAQQTMDFGAYESTRDGDGGGPTDLPPPPPLMPMLPLPQSSSSSVSSSPQHLKSSGQFSSPSGKQFRTSSSTDEATTSPRNEAAVHYSTGGSGFDFPLDYSVVSANRDKEVLEFYKNKNRVRPKSAMYLPSDSYLSSDGSPLGVKPSSLDIQSMMGGHHLNGRSHQMSSPTETLDLSPRLSDRSDHHHQRAPSQPSCGSMSVSMGGHQATSSLVHGIGVPAYYMMYGGRDHHHHHQHHQHHHHHQPQQQQQQQQHLTGGSPRYCSPPTTLPYMSRSGESLLGCSSVSESSSLIIDSKIYGGGPYGCAHPSPSPSPSHFGYAHSPSHSIELPNFHHGVPTRRAGGPVIPSAVVGHSSHPTGAMAYRTGSNGIGGGGDSLGFGSYDGPSTIPKRSHYRIRIPSNQSVTSKSSAGKVSTGSIERAFMTADRTSPMPVFHVETITPNGTIVQRSISDFQNKKPSPGELRNIRINKNTEETLGIQIDCGPRGGIFVSSVSENSLAAQAGIHIGDQLLEVCGINMRSATYLLAANVLRQCGDSVTMFVQYNPDKYRESLRASDDSGSSSGGNGGDDDDDDDEDDVESPMNTPTPRTSPKDARSNANAQLMELRGGGDDGNSGQPASATSTLKRKGTLVASKKSSKEEQPAMMMSGEDIYEPRFVFLKTVTSSLGITFLGGNAVGIFVHKVQPDSPANGPSGLRCGDRILEYNGIDLRQATAEQAAYELAKRADTITILAQYDIDRYTEVQHLPGDSLFVRAMFDHAADGANELSFRKDDILYVDNTMFNGVNGLWRAWLVDDGGHKKQCGVIPSKYKVEEDLLLRRSLGELDSETGSSRRNSAAASARRSFFRRYRKHHHGGGNDGQQQQNAQRGVVGIGGGSRDSKELASFSDASMNSCSGDSGAPAEVEPPISTYMRVERLDPDLVVRPVLVSGPLIDVVVDKLVQDFPHKFARCVPEVINASLQAMEKGLEEGVYVDFRRRGGHFECITLASVREICDRACHCILEVSPVVAERLHRVHVYPIVLFIKFKSTKQIREVKDPRSVNSEKVTTKAAKEMYDHTMRLEQEYRQLISATIPGGNLSYMCSQIKSQVDQEQSKTLWVPAAGSI